MTGRLVLLVLISLAAAAATLKLFLKDGSFHLVREYSVAEDRVRFYSVERSQWEEIPLDLVDLDKTRSLSAEREASIRKEEALAQEERALERQMRREVAMVPAEPGLYLLESGSLREIPPAELRIATDKGRSITKILVPIPVVAGKQVVEVAGVRSPNVVRDAQPEFYVRLSRRERVALVRLPVKKDYRIVQTWQIVPVSNEVFEEQEEVEIFRRQAGEDLYKLWPAAPLPPGEYAFVQYSQGERNVLAWDFSVQPEGVAAAPEAAPAPAKKKGKK